MYHAHTYGYVVDIIYIYISLWANHRYEGKKLAPIEYLMNIQSQNH